MNTALLAPLLLMFGGLELELHVIPPDGGTFTVGQGVTLVLEARHAPGEVALLPSVLPLPESLAERPGSRRRSRTREAEVEIDRFEIELMPFEAGTLTVPPLEVAVGSTTASTRSLELEVGSNLSADEQLVASTTIAEAAGAALAELERLSAPDPGLRSVLVPNLPLLYGLAFIAALLVVVLLVRRLWRPREATAVTEPPPPPPRPADEVALERLEALARAGFLERGDLKSYFVELSEILRVYVGARYHFDSVELTHFELTLALRQFDTPGLDEDAFLRLLQEADLVKFAKFSPTEEEARALWSRARAMVLSTRPKTAEAAA